MESFKVHNKVGIGEWKLQLGEIAYMCLIAKKLRIFATCDSLPHPGKLLKKPGHYMLWSIKWTVRW